MALSCSPADCACGDEDEASLSKRAVRTSRSWTFGRRGSLGQVCRAARADLRRAFS